MAVQEVRPGEQPVEPGMSVSRCVLPRCDWTIAWWSPQDEETKNAMVEAHMGEHGKDKYEFRRMPGLVPAGFAGSRPRPRYGFRP